MLPNWNPTIAQYDDRWLNYSQYINAVGISGVKHMIYG